MYAVRTVFYKNLCTQIVPILCQINVRIAYLYLTKIDVRRRTYFYVRLVYTWRTYIYSPDSVRHMHTNF